MTVRRTWTLWVGLLSLATAASAQTASPARSLADEPGLARSESFDRMFVPVGEFVAGIGRASGVDLRVAPFLAERTAHVFVSERPLAWTLERVASALDLEWVRRGDHWFLQQPTAAAAALRAYRANVQTSGIDGVLDRLASVGRLSPEQIEIRIRALDTERAALEEDIANIDLQAHVRLLQQIADLRTARDGAYPLALLAADPNARSRLSRGEIVAAAYPPRPGVVALPPTVLAWLSLARRADGADSLAVVAVPGNRTIRFVTAAWNAQTPARRTTHTGQIDFHDPPEPAPAWVRRLESWSTPAPEFLAHPLLRRSVARRVPGESFSSPWFGGVFTAGDWFRDLHRRSGIDVVADAYRMRVNVPGDAGAARTVGEWLDAVASGIHGAFRIESDALLFRPLDLVDAQTTAVRESELQRLEAAGEPPAYDPPIDAYAALASGLRLDQAESIQALRVSAEPLNRAAPQLALYWSLTADQRRRLRERIPIRFEELDEAQRRRFIAALVHAAVPSGRADLAIEVLAAPDLGQLAVLVEQELFDVRTADESGSGVRVAETAGASPADRGAGRIRLYRFFLGFSAEQAATTEFQIRERRLNPGPDSPGPG